MQKILNDAYRYTKQWIGQGNVANYIPELAKADSNNLSICVTDLNGYTYSAEVFNRVGLEPTGDPFNSIVRLETMYSHKPLNPMINAGAIAVASCISGESSEERFEKILSNARLLLDNSELDYNKQVYQSENEHGGRNRALAYMMSADSVFSGNVEEHVNVYFKACSIMATCEEISYFGAVISNDGVSPRTGKRLIGQLDVKLIRSLMCTCGMYDEYQIV
ncbi:MAG: glsA [Sedimentibacter sp.]|nr:glsA [Sedimentibacter sp.]